MFGIKEPYYKLSYDGTLLVRNDNPTNLIFRPGHFNGVRIDMKDYGRFMEMGMKLYNEG